MHRRRVLRAFGAALGAAGLSGCLSGSGPGGSDASPTATDTTTDPDATTGDPEGMSKPKATGDGTVRPASRQPDPHLPVEVENRDDVTHTVDLTVTRSGTTVHEASYDVAPGVERDVYNLREADPDGIETFTVEVSVGDGTDAVEVETSGCYGQVVASVREDGSLLLTYSIC
ncbi:hypothetical protein BRD00_05875 [Halobacteriales archaeon QS_8_69_26]|nr:MAG: hypothetical protein BRD00_05875 [Halobacteriales archaeon QS_8_69_26]